MKLEIIPAAFIDRAWKEGASCLAEACEESNGEITGDQLKLILSRGERMLVRMENEGETVGWGCVRVDQLPNVRVLHIAEMTAPHSNYPLFFGELSKMAQAAGCSEVRFSCKPAQARLFKRVGGVEEVYTTLRIKL